MEKTVKQIIDSEYRDYSMYVLEQRAIPSAVDGLKAVHRKLLFSAMKKCATKKVKVSDIAGGLSGDANYHHGSASAEGATVGMAADWSNNAPLLAQYGNFGSRLVPAAAAPRYIFVKLSDNYKKWFGDEEILHRREDPEDPEPRYYLPSIPWVLVNGIKGIAVGFATEILPRNPVDLQNACLQYMETGKITSQLKPRFPNFRGTVNSLGDGKWVVKGNVKKEKLTYIIDEVPIGHDRESYINVLTKLEEAGRIGSFQDGCDSSGFRFSVSVSRKQADVIDKDSSKFFKLEKIYTENLTCLDNNGKLIQFDNVKDLIAWFVDFRLSECDRYISDCIIKLNHKFDYLYDVRKFIECVVAGDIDLRAMTKVDVIDYIEKNITTESYGKEFLNISFYRFTADEVTKLTNKISGVRDDIKIWEKKTNKSYYKELLS